MDPAPRGRGARVPTSRHGMAAAKRGHAPKITSPLSGLFLASHLPNRKTRQMRPSRARDRQSPERRATPDKSGIRAPRNSDHPEIKINLPQKGRRHSFTHRPPKEPHQPTQTKKTKKTKNKTESSNRLELAPWRPRCVPSGNAQRPYKE